MIKTILIVEDDRESNDYLALYLRKQYEVVLSAYDGVEALHLYQEHMPDLIFSDIEMPKMDGLKLIQKIRQKDTTTPIVILSANLNQEYLIKAIPLQLVEYLLKPITFNKIDSLLKLLNDKMVKNEPNKIFIDKVNNTYYDYPSKTVFIKKQRIVLTNLEIALLELLLENRNEVVHYDNIEEALYPTVPNSRNALKCLIKNLRAKIPTIMIQTIPKVGYSLI